MTLHAGTLTSGYDYAEAAPTTTEFDMFVMDGSAHNLTIPEPSAALLGAVGILSLLRRRR